MTVILDIAGSMGLVIASMNATRRHCPPDSPAHRAMAHLLQNIHSQTIRDVHGVTTQQGRDAIFMHPGRCADIEFDGCEPWVGKIRIKRFV